MVNIRDKGQGAEREVCDWLNAIYLKVLTSQSRDLPEKRNYPFQRNQLQTAVGGSDIANPFKLDIEVKRQEALSINTWWKQTVASAARTNGIPILVFKQNRKPWRVLMFGIIPVDAVDCVEARCEISLEDFLKWIESYLQANA